MAGTRLFSLAFFLVLALSLVSPLPSLCIDQWGIAGHGVSRATFNGSSSSWVSKLARTDADSCYFPEYETPFSWWDTPAGSVLSNGGQLYATLYCAGDQPYTYSASLWAIDANSGDQIAVATYDNVTTWDSYARILPDGTVAVGTNQAAVTLFDATTLDVVSNVTGLVQGYGGAMVLGVFKQMGTTTQITSAGGDGGSYWWGAVCDIVDGHTLIDCQLTTDSTVCIGADGVTAYNNQRYENPQGAVRYNLPLPSTPTIFNTNYVSWPWWIRSDLSGNVYVYDGEFLTKYAQNTKQIWQIDDQFDWLGLMLTDDESIIVLSNQTHIAALSPSSGETISIMSFEKAFGRGITCGAVFSPWMNGLPVPLADSVHVIVVCGTTAADAFVSVLDISGASTKSGISFSKKTALTVPPAQIIVDNVGNVYAFGHVKKIPTVQKISYSSL